MPGILSEIADNQGARYKAKRKGRGIASGKGKTCARGVKGQKSRSGVAIKGFEGGQMPIHRRLPKRGFNNYSRKVFEVVNIGDLQQAVDGKKLDAKKSVNIEALLKAGLVSDNKDGIKLLSKGEIKTSIKIEVDKASEAAVKAVEKAGGSVSFAENKSAAPKKETAKKSAPKKSEAK